MRTPQPHPPWLGRRPAPTSRRLLAAALLVALAAGPLTACGLAATTATPSGIPYELHTHCGITDLTFEGTRYSRVGGTLDDGSGNPPDGWANPLQDGWLVLGEDSVTFEDDAGHSEVFTPRTATTPTLRPCD